METVCDHATTSDIFLDIIFTVSKIESQLFRIYTGPYLQYKHLGVGFFFLSSCRTTKLVDKSGFELSESAAPCNKWRWELPVTCSLAG